MASSMNTRPSAKHQRQGNQEVLTNVKDIASGKRLPLLECDREQTKACVTAASSLGSYLR